MVVFPFPPLLPSHWHCLSLQIDLFPLKLAAGRFFFEVWSFNSFFYSLVLFFSLLVSKGGKQPPPPVPLFSVLFGFTRPCLPVLSCLGLCLSPAAEFGSPLCPIASGLLLELFPPLGADVLLFFFFFWGVFSVPVFFFSSPGRLSFFVPHTVPPFVPCPCFFFLPWKFVFL